MPVREDRQLSTAAVRLLSALRRHGARSSEAALTDARLAELTHLPEREIIDAAAELLAAGVLCLAGPRGRWLGSLPEARRYRDALRRRGRAVLHRLQLVDSAIRRAEAGRSPDDLGQLALPLEGG